MSLYLSVRSAGSCLSLEVISGPSSGLQCTVQSTNASKLILGRVSPSDFVLKDSEVSGKHALVNWNSNVKFRGSHATWYFWLLLICVRGDLILMLRCY